MVPTPSRLRIDSRRPLKRNETIIAAPNAIRLERIQMNLAVW